MPQLSNVLEWPFRSSPHARPWRIIGHAIVSDDDRIAAADGSVPAPLRNEADWQRFQAALDRADLIVLGREGHEANPNRPNRRRLVLTSRVDGLERDRGEIIGQVFRLNPDKMPLEAALDALLPVGGIVAVPGGTRVFDLFLSFGFDEFHLARARGVSLPGGRPIFSACDRGEGAATVLASAGLSAGKTESLDAAARVDLTIFRAQRG